MYETKQNKIPASRAIYRQEQKGHAHLFFKGRSNQIAMQLKVIQLGENFFSSYDNSAIFSQRNEAALYDNFLRSRGRLPTLYTYTHTRGENVNTFGIPQGPHFVGYAAIENALEEAFSHQDLMNVFTEVCVDPDTWLSLVKEILKRQEIHPDKILESRLDKAHIVYIQLYNDAQNAINSKQINLQHIIYFITRLVQLHPLTTYAWYSTKKAPKSALKGKNENSNILDEKNIDTLSYQRGIYSIEEYIYNLAELADGDYRDERQEEEEDFEEEEEDFEEEEEDFEEDPEDIEDYINDEDIDIKEFQTIENEFEIGNASGEGNLCLIDTIVQLLRFVNIELNQKDLVQYLADIGIQIGQMLDFFTVDITQNIATYFDVRFQVHVVALNGMVCNYPIIGKKGPILHILHNGAHFSPLFPRSI